MIFSIIYSALDQRKFKEMLDKGNLDAAVTILESLPRGRSREECEERARVMVEGYRAIVGIPNRDLIQLRNDFKRLSDYEGEVGSLGFSRRIFSIVQDHMRVPLKYGDGKSLGTDTRYDFEDEDCKGKILEQELSELREYRGLGIVDEIYTLRETVQNSSILGDL